MVTNWWAGVVLPFFPAKPLANWPRTGEIGVGLGSGREWTLDGPKAVQRRWDCALAPGSVIGEVQATLEPFRCGIRTSDRWFYGAGRALGGPASLGLCPGGTWWHRGTLALF